MGRRSISEQRRMEIGRALQICVSKNGSYESTSVKDIALQAGIATGLVHHYFSSKDEILMLMADTELLSVANQLEDLLHTHQTGQRRQLLHDMLSNQNQNRFMMMLFSLSLSMPELKQLILEKHRELRQSLSARLRRSRSFHGDPEQKAYELMFLLESAFMYSALAEQEALEILIIDALDSAFPVSVE